MSEPKSLLSSFMRKTSNCLKKKESSPAEESADSDDLSVAKHRSIKAFRTIITLLNSIPNQPVMNVVERPPGGVDDRELKLLNALATLLVRSHEVAAVVVTQYNDGSGAVQVTACLHHDISSDSGELTISQQSQPSESTLNTRLYKYFLATFNPHPDTPSEMSDRPKIINPKDHIPSNVQKIEVSDSVQILDYCYKTW